MSLRKGGDKKKPQKYQNSTAYKVKFNPQMEAMVSNAPLDRLCQRCFQQIKWKLQFGKYKPKGSISRWQVSSSLHNSSSNKCQQKSICKSYRTICDKCADNEALCTKCGQSKDYVPDPHDEPKLDKNGIDKEKLKQMEDYLDTLKERSRRKILRLINKGQIDWDGTYFVEIESKTPIEGLRFKGDVDNLEDNWDDDEDMEDDDGDFDDDDDGDFDDDDNDLEEKKEDKIKPKKK